MPPRTSTAKAEQQAAVEVLSGTEAQVFHAIELAQKEVAPLREYLGAERCHPERLKEEARTYIELSGRAHIEAGIRLKVLRAGMPHGEFKRYVEAELPCTYEHASKLCGLIDRMLHLHDQSGGKWQLEDMRQLDMKKVFAAHRIAEIASDELTTAGTVDGKTLDEIALTPRAQLEARARELEAEKEALEKQIEKGEEQLRKAREKTTQVLNEFNEYRVASPENVIKACTRLQRDLANAVHEFMRTLPQGQHLAPLPLAAVHSTIGHTQTLCDQTVQFILEQYPQAEYARVQSEARMTTEPTEADLLKLPIYDVPGLPAQPESSTEEPTTPQPRTRKTKGNGKAE